MDDVDPDGSHEMKIIPMGDQTECMTVPKAMGKKSPYTLFRYFGKFNHGTQFLHEYFIFV